MDSTEIHYLTYDPEEIYKEMQYAFIEAGGDVLYPGDEKEMLLRGVQSVIVQAFAGVDNALRMATLRYAVGEYLDIYGEKRNCVRMQAMNAVATVEITFRATGIAKTIEAGTALTADGEHMYILNEDVLQSGYEQAIQVGVTALDAGSAGNGLYSGAQMQFMVPQEGVQSVYCIEDAQGGQEREDDETYRERIRTYGLSSITTGPQGQYEAAAKGVTSRIVDARAINLGAGKVGVYLILESQTGAEAILDAVRDALNAAHVRPLTDNVEVHQANEKAYTLNVRYMQAAGSNIAAFIADAVKEYQTWQDNTIGRAFNPDRLLALLYQAGATRAFWGEGSHFDGAEVAYKAIPEDTRCKGTITLAVIDA